MEGKVLLQDLAEGLAGRKQLSKKEAEAFVRAVFELIEEGLLSDQLVKVKGIGTFKLVTVDSRESINVNTGERFTIDSHSKITFSPDKALGDRINRPFADFETTILNDGTKTEDMERIEPLAAPTPEPEPENVQEEKAEPIQEVLVAPEAEPQLEAEPIPEPEAASAPEVVPVPESEPVADIEPAAVSEPEPDTVVEPVATSEPEPAAAIESLPAPEPEVVPGAVPEAVSEPSSVVEEEPARKTGRPLLWVASLLLLSLLAAWHFFGPLPATKSNDKKVATAEVRQTTVKPSPRVDAQKSPDSLAMQPKPEPHHVNIEELVAQYAQLKYGEYWIVGTKTVVTLQRGDDLSKLALEHYGDKKLINYIIKHNGYSAAQANGLKVGAEVKIPILEKRVK